MPAATRPCNQSVSRRSVQQSCIDVLPGAEAALPPSLLDGPFTILAHELTWCTAGVRRQRRGSGVRWNGVQSLATTGHHDLPCAGSRSVRAGCEGASGTPGPPCLRQTEPTLFTIRLSGCTCAAVACAVCYRPRLPPLTGPPTRPCF